MKTTTMHIQVGETNEVRVALRDGERPIGDLRISGSGVTWEAGAATHTFTWEAWLRMIAERGSDGDTDLLLDLDR